MCYVFVGDELDMIQRLGPFLHDLIGATPRPRRAMLKAALQAVPADEGLNVDEVATKVAGLVSWLRKKRQNACNLSRTPPEVAKLLDAFPKCRLGSQFKAKARMAMSQSPKKIKLSLEEQIAAMYGVQAMTKESSSSSTLAVVCDEDDAEMIVEVASSEFEEAAPKEKAAKEKAGQHIVYYDAAMLTMARASHDGVVEHAVLQKGTQGFALAVWPDGSVQDTEITNLGIAALPNDAEDVEQGKGQKEQLKKKQKKGITKEPKKKQKKGIMKKPAAAQEVEEPTQPEPTHDVPRKFEKEGYCFRLILGKEQAYVTAQFEDGKKKLWVTCAKKRASRVEKDHQALVKQLFMTLRASDNLTKEKALELFKQILSGE